MATKRAKTAEKGSAAQAKRTCPSCGGDVRVTLFTGHGQRGFFWLCDKNCGYMERTR